MKSQVLHVPLYVNLTHWEFWRHRKQIYFQTLFHSKLHQSSVHARESPQSIITQVPATRRRLCMAPQPWRAAPFLVFAKRSRYVQQSWWRARRDMPDISNMILWKKNAEGKVLFKTDEQGKPVGSQCWFPPPPPPTVNARFPLKCMDSSRSIQSSWSQPRWSPGRKHLHFQDHCRDQWRARLLSAEAQKKA